MYDAEHGINIDSNNVEIFLLMTLQSMTLGNRKGQHC